MNKWKKAFKIADTIGFVTMIIFFLASIIISIIGFIGLQLPLTINVLMILTLVSLGFGSMFIILDKILKAFESRVIYYENAEVALMEIEKMCLDAETNLYVLGSKAKNQILKIIEKAIVKKELSYKHLITVKEIDQSIKKHIKNKRELPNSEIRYLDLPNSHNILLTEKKVLIGLPSGESGDFRAVVLSDKASVAYYTGYFHTLFKQGESVETVLDVIG